jgi:ABC-2 type transport system permease protein
VILVIARREIVTRARSKGFRVVTGLLLLGVVGLALFQSVVFGGDDARSVTVGLTEEAADWADALGGVEGELEVDTTVLSGEPADAFDDDPGVDVVFDGEALIWERGPDGTLDAYVRAVVQRSVVADRLAAEGLDPGRIEAVFSPVRIGEVRLDDDADRGVRLVVAGASGFAIFMLLQVWGSFLMMGVIEEKSSRVVEVLLSHVRPATLLAGKVLGLGTLALAQMLIVVGGLALGLAVVDDISVPTGVWGTVPLSLATFLLGFGFYAAAFAAVGSMVSRQEDASAAQMPVILPLLAGYFVAVGSLAEPDNVAVTVGSFVPFTAPVLLPFRHATTTMPTWEVLVALGVLAVSIVVMVRLAGRIYRSSLLRIGSRVSWRRAWRVDDAGH